MENDETINVSSVCPFCGASGAQIVEDTIGLDDEIPILYVRCRRCFAQGPRAYSPITARILWETLDDQALHSVNASLTLNSPVPIGMRVADLDPSVRLRNRLEEMGVFAIAQLLNISAKELLNRRQFGRVCLSELREKLSAHGLSLRDDPIA
jgi:DNA-directed RNA polymerase alpha subunit